MRIAACMSRRISAPKRVNRADVVLSVYVFTAIRRVSKNAHLDSFYLLNNSMKKSNDLNKLGHMRHPKEN